MCVGLGAAPSPSFFAVPPLFLQCLTIRNPWGLSVSLLLVAAARGLGFSGASHSVSPAAVGGGQGLGVLVSLSLMDVLTFLACAFLPWFDAHGTCGGSGGMESFSSGSSLAMRGSHHSLDNCNERVHLWFAADCCGGWGVGGKIVSCMGLFLVPVGP